MHFYEFPLISIDIYGFLLISIDFFCFLMISAIATLLVGVFEVQQPSEAVLGK